MYFQRCQLNNIVNNHVLSCTFLELICVLSTAKLMLGSTETARAGHAFPPTVD